MNTQELPTIDMKSFCMKADRGILPTKSAFLESGLWSKVNLCQVKADGMHSVVLKEDGRALVYTSDVPRTNSQLNPTFEALEKFLPDNTIIVGELGFGSQAETIWASEHGYHRYIVFDVLVWAGQFMRDFTALQRYLFLRKKFEELKPEKLFLIETEVLPADPRSCELAWAMFERVVASGGEGLMIKDSDLKFRAGRTNGMCKVKKTVSREYVCMGFSKTDASTYIKQGFTVGAILGGLYVNGTLKEVVSVGAFDFSWRRKFSDNPEEYIGKVVELGGYEIFKSGALRHPFFVKFRDDKTHEDCVL